MSLSIAAGAFSVTRHGIERFNTARPHMIGLGRVVGSFVEPQRNGSRTPAQNNNINVTEISTLATVSPLATHLIGTLFIVPASGDGEPFGESPFPGGYPCTFTGGTFQWHHNIDFLSAHTIYLDSGLVRLRRRVVTTLPAPSSGIRIFSIRGFTLHYSLRAVRFL